ncbi:MAG TPA: response regulator [Gammaproteobacteria bacterium]|nr:response regulator [Gammaproteobacteria bacterium]
MTGLRRILCAEDDPDIRLVIELALARVGGYEVRMCADGAETLAAAQAFHPDIILLDVMMPGLDGPATLAALRAAGIRAPVAFMTAKAMPDDVRTLAALGIAGVITKPFDPMTLADEVYRIWERQNGSR